MKNIIKKSLLLVLVPTFITLSFNHTVAFYKANAEQITDKNDMVRLATLAYGKDSSTTMTFTWNSTNFTNSIVEISEGTFDANTAKKYEGTIEISKASSEDGYIHRVIASYLTPDTTYQYRVGDPSLHTSEIGTFKTSSLDNKSFSFMHISDPQGISDADYLSYNSLLKTVSSSFSFDFFALTGDIVNNSWKDHNPNLTQWENALTLQHEVIKDYPIMAVAGNHEAADYDFSSRFTYETTDNDKKSGVYYSFVYEGVYFLALNTNDALDEEPGSSLSEEQFSFIEADLEAHKDTKWKIVLMHKGLFDAGAHASNLAENKDYDIEHYRNDLAPLFSEYNVDLVLQGHDHLYSKSYPISSTINNGIVAHEPKVDTLNETYEGTSYAYHPDGPIYLNSGSASGSKYYGINMSEEMKDKIDYAFNPVTKLFTNIEIDQTNNRLTFNTYKQENDSYELFKSYGINKGEKLLPDNPDTPSNDEPTNDNPQTQIDLPLIITLSVVGGVVLIGLIITTIILIKRRKK